MSMFASAYVPSERTYRLVIRSRMAGNWAVIGKASERNVGAISVSDNDGDNDGDGGRDRDGDDGCVGWLGWNRDKNTAAAAVANDFPTSSGSSSIMSVSFQEEFIISSIFGSDKLREVALKDPFKSLQLQPYVTIAVRTIDYSERDLGLLPPERGMAFCGGGLIGDLGLPFHVEGPFLQNPGVRSLLLPICPDTFAANMSRGGLGQVQIN